MTCEYWDSGWCYAEGTKYVNGCVGETVCEYVQAKPPARIDVIGQNGNDGTHYLVEKIAKRLAGKDYDMMLSGKGGVRRRWVDFIPLAMDIMEIVDANRID